MRDCLQPGPDQAIDFLLPQGFANSFESFCILDMNEHFSFSVSVGSSLQFQNSQSRYKRVGERRCLKIINSLTIWFCCPCGRAGETSSAIWKFYTCPRPLSIALLPAVDASLAHHRRKEPGKEESQAIISSCRPSEPVGFSQNKLLEESLALTMFLIKRDHPVHSGRHAALKRSFAEIVVFELLRMERREGGEKNLDLAVTCIYESPHQVKENPGSACALPGFCVALLVWTPRSPKRPGHRDNLCRRLAYRRHRHSPSHHRRRNVPNRPSG